MQAGETVWRGLEDQSLATRVDKMLDNHVMPILTCCMHACKTIVWCLEEELLAPLLGQMLDNCKVPVLTCHVQAQFLSPSMLRLIRILRLLRVFKVRACARTCVFLTIDTSDKA